MSFPYVGEIRMFAGNYAPEGWMFCEGQTLVIADYESLFSLIGTRYGGDGETTFALPDMRGRLPIHQGKGFSLSQIGGVEEVSLTLKQIPAHSHQFFATRSAALRTGPDNSYVLASAEGSNISPYVDPYGDNNPNNTLSPKSVGLVGGSMPHSNIQPYLCVSFIISLDGIFPSEN